MKIYVINKYIPARSIQDALRKEKDFPADECFIDQEFRREYIESKIKIDKPLGFKDGYIKKRNK